MSPLPVESSAWAQSEWSDWILKKLYSFHAQAQNASEVESENMTLFFHVVSEMPNGSAILKQLIAKHFVPNVTLHHNDDDPSIELTFHCENSNGATKSEVVLADNIAFWVEAVLQSIVAIIGIICNTTAIAVLASSHRRLMSVFNSILSCLLIIHTFYILTNMILVLRMWNQSPFLDYLFPHFLYPLKPLLLHSSTFLTAVMARERYKAIRHPLEYRNATAGISPWKTAYSYLIPVFILALVFVSPLYFESKLVDVQRELSFTAPDGTQQMVNVTKPELHVTEFRLNSHYIMWYKNVATLMVTILIPLFLIAWWNWHTYSVIKRRQRLKNRPQLNIKACLAKEEEAKKARILFVIVFIFIMCNLLRVILNVEETVSMRAYQNAAKQGCNSVPLWALVMNTCSQFLLTLNATCGVLIYCAMSQDFRQQLFLKFDRFHSKMYQKWLGDQMPTHDDSISGVMVNMNTRKSVVYDLVNGISRQDFSGDESSTLLNQHNLSRVTLGTSSGNSECTPHNSGSSSLNSYLIHAIGSYDLPKSFDCDQGSSAAEEDGAPLVAHKTKRRQRETSESSSTQVPAPQTRKKHTFVTVLVH